MNPQDMRAATPQCCAHRARNAIKGLMAMTPELAAVQAEDGAWRDIHAKDVTVGALVRVKPGERIPLDGTVVSSRSDDQPDLHVPW